MSTSALTSTYMTTSISTHTSANYIQLSPVCKIHSLSTIREKCILHASLLDILEMFWQHVVFQKIPLVNNLFSKHLQTINISYWVSWLTSAPSSFSVTNVSEWPYLNHTINIFLSIHISITCDPISYHAAYMNAVRP